MLITPPPIIKSLKKAQDLADKLNAERDWTYKVKKHGENRASIEVYDEDGIHLGSL